MGTYVRALRADFTFLIISFDLLVWLLAALLVGLLRYSTVSEAPWSALVVIGAVTGLLYVALGRRLYLHQGRARSGSLEEMVLLGTVAGCAGAMVFAVNLLGIWAARSTPAMMTVVFLVIAGWGRAMWRLLSERDVERRRSEADGTSRVLVIGAGEGAQSLINSMYRDPQHRWHPVGMLDDDARKQHLRVRQVPVLGRTHDLVQIAREHRIDAVILAIPSADRDFVRRVSRAADKAGLPLKVLPATAQLLSDQVGIRDLRDINLTDVLGRTQLDTDVSSIAGYLKGKRVLVTGAGGSIGSELCRQIHRFEPAELMMLDRDESALHAVQLSITGRALLDGNDVVLCDIRDSAALDKIFRERRPEVVFHAAALKHLPMLEQYPAEAVKTNIIGTRNVLDAATAAGVTRFVNISTDKAANPASVLGYSKRIAERITAAYAGGDGAYLSVRFGNVLGSRGSVLTAFAKQIADGGPVTVTDRDVTRFFMTIEEACQLVIQAGAIGEAGEALVLDMGEPVRIVDVAHQLIEQSGRHIAIEYTGLRAGEKMHEELFGDDEPHDVRPTHPMVSHVPVPPVAASDIELLEAPGLIGDVTAAMAALCETLDLDSLLVANGTAGWADR